MLVLSRKSGERIRIGEGESQITITTVRIGPNTVRLGIDAPHNMNIVREEIASESVIGHSAEPVLAGAA